MLDCSKKSRFEKGRPLTADFLQNADLASL
jgi:hypothetical protein